MGHNGPPPPGSRPAYSSSPAPPPWRPRRAYEHGMWTTTHTTVWSSGTGAGSVHLADGGWTVTTPQLHGATGDTVRGMTVVVGGHNDACAASARDTFERLNAWLPLRRYTLAPESRRRWWLLLIIAAIIILSAAMALTWKNAGFLGNY